MDEVWGMTPAEPSIEASAWDAFEARLAAYLATMHDPAGDHLLLEVPGDEDEGCAPYAQFASFDEGRMIRAELSGNEYLAPQFRLGASFFKALWNAGWQGGMKDEPNFYGERPLGEARSLASTVVKALRDFFHIPDPGLLTYQAWGPAADGASVLGLVNTEEVPVDVVDVEQSAEVEPAHAVRPSSRDHLVELVREALRDWMDDDPAVDDDDDFVLEHLGQPVWLRVRKDQPAAVVMARVVHNVRSRRATETEIGLLNRDNLWNKWSLRGRDVWQTAVIPCAPFAREHLAGLIRVFMEAMDETRDDLAYRTGGKPG